MKKVFQLAILTMALFPVIGIAQTKSAAWPEMKTFHSYMAATFHPAEEGNLQPLREKADSLYNAAKNWQASAIPSNYKPTETTAALKKLVKQCASIKKYVDAKMGDKDLTHEITEAHEIFHNIAGECKKADE